MKKTFPVLFFFFLLPAFVFSQDLNITSKVIKESNPYKHYDIDVVYPQVDFGPEALMGIRGIAGDINNYIDTMITNRINSFMSEAMEFGYDTNTKANSSLDIKYTSTNNNSSLISFRFTIFYYFSGAAHPMTEIKSFNYSFTSGGVIELSDLFLPNSGYLTDLSQYSINALNQRLKEDGIDDSGWVAQGAGPKPENYSVWNIGGDSLLITFNAYQVGPYVIGIQEVSVPFSNLMNMIDPKGPLAYLLK